MAKVYRRCCFIGIAIVAGSALSWASHAVALPIRAPTYHLRHPVALALADNGRWLFVANQRSGTVCSIDMKGGRIAGETVVGRKLSDLAITPDGALVLVVDEDANGLTVLH